MRATFLFLWLAISASCFSQNYVLDPTFGNAGKLVKNWTFTCKDVILYNNSYYFISDNNVFKTLYNGDTDTSFGTSGIISLNSNGVLHSISGFKIIEGYIYVYGKTYSDTTNNNDAFLAKINIDSGALDTSFGTNGISYINFSGNESINDFVYNTDGSFYCIGTRSEVMIYFKITAGGNLDTAFDTASGYKQILLNQKSYGNAIKFYNGNFLLIGTDYLYNGSIYESMMLAMVDAQGNLINSYGINGVKTVELYAGMNTDILNTIISGNMLYVNYFYIWYSSKGSNTIKYDLETDNTVYNNPTSYYMATHNELIDGKLYTTGFNSCFANFFCDTDFNINRLLDDGTMDSSFNQTGTYTYNFPGGLPISQDRSFTFTVGADGSILIAGYRSLGTPNAAMIRIVDATSLTETEKNIVKNTITPNPFKDHINVKANQAPDSAEVYDLTGRLVANPTVNYNNGSTELKLDNITQRGIYLLKLDFGNKTETHKIIKQ